MSRIPTGLLPDHSSVGPEGQLLIAGVDVAEVAAEHGTPLFVYDEDQIRARCREAVEVFGDGNVVLRDQGLPVPGHRPPRPRGGAAARRGHRW